jgi:hypothetical protein
MSHADLFAMWIVLFAIYSTACFTNIIEHTQPGHTVGTSDNANNFVPACTVLAVLVPKPIKTS